MMNLLAAALITATPATFAARIDSAKPGDTLQLAAGDYGSPTIARKTWAPVLTIDARAARFTGWMVTGVQGLRIRGGTVTSSVREPDHLPVAVVDKSQDVGIDGTSFVGPGGPGGVGTPGGSGTGLLVRYSQNVTLDNGKFSGLRKGVVYNMVTGGHIKDTMLTSLRSDGINLASSHQITVQRIECVDFSPIVPVDHPDCVQLWSVKGQEPTSDITVRDSKATGSMQGFTAFDHGTGGFDRLTFINNIVRNNYPHGIAMYAARNSVIRGNDIASIPGSRYWPVVHVGNNTDTVVEDNRIAPRPPR